MLHNFSRRWYAAFYELGLWRERTHALSAHRLVGVALVIQPVIRV